MNDAPFSEDIPTSQQVLAAHSKQRWLTIFLMVLVVGTPFIGIGLIAVARAGYCQLPLLLLALYVAFLVRFGIFALSEHDKAQVILRKIN